MPAFGGGTVVSDTQCSMQNVRCVELPSASSSPSVSERLVESETRYEQFGHVEVLCELVPLPPRGPAPPGSAGADQPSPLAQLEMLTPQLFISSWSAV